jgi:hypothetical protein
VRSFIRALRVLHGEYRQTRRSVTFLATIAVASPLLGTNVVFNPSFHGSLAGWGGGGTTFDATNDATGLPGSGSARNVGIINGNTIALTQCIPVAPGTYTLGAKMFIPSGQTATGIAVIGVTWADGFCMNSSSVILGSRTFPVVTTGSFVTVSTTAVAPPGTRFAFVNAQHIGTAGHVAYYDDIVLDDGTNTNVPALGPFALAALMLVLAALGLAALRH